jgi:histidinol-phosphate aminotransferase
VGERALSVLAPFGEFGRAVALSGGQVEIVRPEQVVDAVQPGIRLVYLGHPHNPTGTLLSPDEFTALQSACQRADALLLVDLAYAPFLHLPSPTSWTPALTSHTLLLHSPGKVHGLVGARPAYALAPLQVAAALHNLAPAWALPAGTAALLERLPDAQEFLQATLPQVAQNAAVLAQKLSARFEVEHHGTPYMTVRVGDAAGVTARLLKENIRVRDCCSYGLPEHVRVSARLPAENALLIAALNLELELRR